MKEKQLVFIISQPRSGSTYLQNLLSNNPEVNTCSEPWLLLNFANQLKPSLYTASFDNELAVKAFQNYKRTYPKFDFNKKQKDFLLGLYSPLAEDFKFVLDKTPRYWEIMKEIQQLFPNSRIILLKRNPLNVASSMMKTWNINSLSRLSENYHRDILIAPREIHFFSLKNKTNKNVYVLRYEDLKEETEREIKEIYKWLGINYSNKVLDLKRNKKYKGEFGDPYQNSDKDYKEMKAASDLKKLNKNQKEFLNGYANFLGEDFLKEYGNYRFNGQKKTLEFSYFIHRMKDRNVQINLKKEIRFLFKEVYFRLRKIK